MAKQHIALILEKKDTFKILETNMKYSIPNSSQYTKEEDDYYRWQEFMCQQHKYNKD